MIDARNLPLGQTKEGQSWCIKALHPSDPINEISGVPDESAVPSVFVGYNSQFIIEPPAGVETAWGFEMAAVAHPISPVWVHSHNSDYSENLLFNHLNPQIDGETHQTKYGTFKGLAQRWRLAYYGITIVQDAAALTNQGSIVACQTPMKPTMLGIGGLQALNTASTLATPVSAYQTIDSPLLVNIQSMPNSYSGPSKDGLYMPLKLTRTHQQWHGTHDECKNVGIVVGGEGNYVLPTSAGYGFPFSGEGGTGLSYPWTNAGVLTGGANTSPMTNDVAGQICAENLSPTTRFRVFVRMGYELQVQAGTMLTPYQHISPPNDEVAITTYFAIAREMKDAYPEEYNSFGKLWDVISGIAKTIAPALGFIPTVGPILSAAVGGGAMVGDMIRKATRKPDDMSLAERNHVREALDRTPVLRLKPKKLRVRRKKIASRY